MAQLRWSTFGPVLVRVAINLLRGSRKASDKKRADLLEEIMRVQQSGANIDEAMGAALAEWEAEGAPSIADLDDDTRSVQSKMDE